jgi:endonuclease/exonuclease/phosphatase (EEP) superfamily protein YafD
MPAYPTSLEMALDPEYRRSVVALVDAVRTPELAEVAANSVESLVSALAAAVVPPDATAVRGAACVHGQPCCTTPDPDRGETAPAQAATNESEGPAATGPSTELDD